MRNNFIIFKFTRISISYKKVFQFLNNIKNLNFKNFIIYLKFLSNKVSKIIYKIFICCLKYLFYNNLNLKNYKIFTSKGLSLKKIYYKAKGNFSFLKKNFTNIFIKIYV